MEPLTNAERATLAAERDARRAIEQATDEALNFLVKRLGARLLAAHWVRRGENVKQLTGLTPRERQSIASAAPALYFHGDDYGWTAVGECKPRQHARRLLRGHGATIRAALDDLDRQLGRFERNERDGEQ